jgi:PAS domain S-box-containing protein
VIAAGIGEIEREALLFRAIIDSSDDAIISKDLTGVITSWNRSAERLFGYTAAEAVGQPITILIPPDRLDEEPQILARLKRGERVDHFETIRRRKDGNLLEISLTISPVKDREGNVVGASKIARDITESKRVEAELRRANYALEQFAFSASHDLQEPLRAVKIYSELLLKDHASKLDEEALGFLGYLRDGAMRMERLVCDLLAYTQVPEFQKSSELADAKELLATALQSLENSLAESDARISTDVLPSVRMHPAHLQQLFQNLIGNAIKYRRRGKQPAVRITADRQVGQWVFAVSDNGIGIASEYKENIFGLFKRLHSDAEYSGTGLGLAICKRIVEQYNGRIWVESEPGQGSVFRFTVPD